MANKINVLILGCGNLGSELVKILPEDNFAITAVTRQARLLPNYVESINLAIENLDISALKPFDAIFFMASPDMRTEEAYQAVYIAALSSALSQAKLNQAACFYLITSTAVYGQNQGEWVDENSITRPQAFNGKILLNAENMLRHSGLDYNILRLSGIYGKHSQYLINEILRKSATLNKFPHFTNRIHLYDAANFCHFLLQHKEIKNETIIVSDDFPCERNDLINWLANVLQVDSTVFKMDEAIGISGKKCRNAKLRHLGFNLAFPDYKSGYLKILAS